MIPINALREKAIELLALRTHRPSGSCPIEKEILDSTEKSISVPDEVGKAVVVSSDGTEQNWFSAP